MKNLFICITTFEILVAIKIIKTKKLKKEDCVFFLYNDVKSKQVNHYIKEAKKYSKDVIFFKLNEISYPFYFFIIKKKLKKYSFFENIYLAAIDSSIIHYILSIKKFNCIFTFDNGMTNLTIEYNLNLKISLLKNIAYKIVGNRYNTQKVVSNSKIHYTVYDYKFNSVSKNLFILGELFNPEKKVLPSKKNCNLILIPVFRDLFLYNLKMINYHKELISNFIKKKKDIYIINHPREFEFKNSSKIAKPINSFQIAEDVIINNLLKKFKYISIYSFPLSSVSVNLRNFKRVNNILFTSNFNSIRIKDGFKTAKRLKIIHKIENISNYE